jgi:Ca2+-transporting ATPase
MEKTKMREPPWSMNFADVLSALNVNPDKGLSAGEAKRRRKQYGANRLKEAKAKSAWLILADQFKNLIVLLLADASVLSLAFGDGTGG